MVKRSRFSNTLGPVQFSLSLEGLELGGPRPSAQGAPTFARIAELVSAEIRRGRLRPGDRLPGTRPLAEQLGVGRNTVVAAYAELVSEGWVTTRPAGGSFVSAELPEQNTRHFGKRGPPLPAATAPGFDFEPRARDHAPESPRGVLSLYGGVPDLRQFPAVALARAYRRALRGPGRATLDYTTPFGNARLRAALAQMIAATRALPVSPEQILVTHGSQMALDLVARTLIRPGDRVGVEEIGYQAAWAALRNAGAKLVFLPIDKQGLDVAALELALASAPLRAVCLSPHHQYPTTATLSVARRLRLLELAAQHRFAIIEDDYDHEFHYDGRPLASLAGADRAAVVIYVGTLAKILAPGLRLGFVAAPRAFIETLGALRVYVDRQGDSVTEQAVAELIEEGELGRHARRMRRIYHARRDAFAELLTRHLGRALTFDMPAGGMALWAQARRDIDTQAWLERARQRGVAFATGKSYVAPELKAQKARYYGQFLRLGFARYNEAELATAVKRMLAALQSGAG
jgi:GntR family transcriptional regulator / MocR family aminotransferase